MDPVQRVKSVIEGRRPDRPPVSFWHHFPPDRVCGQAALEAHLEQLEAFDLDFLKVMNDNGYPHEQPIQCVADLAGLKPLTGDEPRFAAQLDLLADLKRVLRGRVLIATTIFNAWTTLRRLMKPASTHLPPKLDAQPDATSERIKAFYREDATAVKSALETIAGNLARFAGRCIEAGADGVYFSVRDDWLTTPGETAGLYESLVRPADLQILDGASGGCFNILHVCGKPVNLGFFADYPVHVVNWADRAAGPSIADARGFMPQAICAGVDNLSTLSDGTPEACAREVRDAIGQAGDRPLMISPGCTFDPDRVPRTNLEAMCRAVREGWA